MRVIFDIEELNAMKVLRGIFEERKFSEKMKKYYEKEGVEILHTMCGKLPVVMIYGKSEINAGNRGIKEGC